MNIVIATGGSGGHLVPALETARELRRRHCEVRFVGAFGAWKDRVSREGFSVDEIDVRGVDLHRPGEYVPAFLRFSRAARRCAGLLKQYNVDAVAGFGGYGAFPAVLAAVLTRRPALIHEQNVVPGRANAVLSRCVVKIAISFPQSRKYFHERKNVVLTGCPSHVPAAGPVDRRSLLAEFGLEEGRKTILVVGGSQGSRRVNEVFIEMLAQRKGLAGVQVVHLSGKADYDFLKTQYASLGIPSSLFDFFDRMDRVYPLADVVVGRAGAVGVTELIRFRKPAILIPYPHAGGHQKYNAEVIASAGAGRYVEEKDFSAVWLKAALEDMLAHLPDPRIWEDHFGELLSRDAAQSLADEIMGMKRCG